MTSSGLSCTIITFLRFSVGTCICDLYEMTSVVVLSERMSVTGDRSTSPRSSLEKNVTGFLSIGSSTHERELLSNATHSKTII